MATACVEVWQTSNLRRLRLGEEKKKKKETTGQKYNGLPYSIGQTINRGIDSVGCVTDRASRLSYIYSVAAVSTGYYLVDPCHCGTAGVMPEK